MNDDRTCKVVETGTVTFFQQGLKTVVAVPDDAFKEGVYEGNGQGRCQQYRIKLSPLSNTAGDNRRNGRSKGQQEEELDQLITVILSEVSGTGEEIDAICNLITDKEVGKGRNAEVGDDFHQRIDLVFMADSAHL